MASVETVFVAKEGGEIIKINKSDLATWKENGYAECEAPKGEDPVMKPKGEDEGISDEMTKNEIATALEDEKYAGIRDGVDMTAKKSDIIKQIASLMNPEFDPDADETEE